MNKKMAPKTPPPINFHQQQPTHGGTGTLVVSVLPVPAGPAGAPCDFRCHISRSQFERWSDVKLWSTSSFFIRQQLLHVNRCFFSNFVNWPGLRCSVLFFKDIFLAFVGSLVEKTWSWDTFCVSISKHDISIHFGHTREFGAYHAYPHRTTLLCFSHLHSSSEWHR